ncbi:hypothetical protein [Cupriavidus numazuensis]|uniref:Lysozyme family protein n=1 Tax=Cupriavidus numazuensis TaxID=221992 RepID=A0ABN7PX87_9BURK|nr:hypothetical protein [Cupriavidus numazuensis]CAG2133484.1 hypothetical protein LMG26411_00790 [Cupriavidus numazuensis]
MATIALTDALRQDYASLFNSCVINAARAADVDGLVRALERNRPRYETAGTLSGVPWHFIAVIHNMESGQRFDCHLHNGDPLGARTTHVPTGRPRASSPPFSWEDSAADALALKGLGAATDWSLAGMLFQVERYNGFGYRSYHPQVSTPYLWSFSNHYIRGKYVADGTWSDTAVSRQCGAAVLLRRMAETGAIGFTDQPAHAEADAPLVVHYAARKPTDPTVIAQADALQRWLNTYPGIFVRLDGYPGKRTSAAYRAVTGHYLPGDPRTSA